MDWKKITSQESINEIMDAYYGFHDSCICSMECKSGASVIDEGSMSGIKTDCSLVIRFESQMPLFHKEPDKKSIELKFIGLRRLNLIGYQNNYFCNVMSCYLSFHRGYIIWSEDNGFDPESYQDDVLFKEPMSTFVVADRLEWRFV